MRPPSAADNHPSQGGPKADSVPGADPSSALEVRRDPARAAPTRPSRRGARREQRSDHSRWNWLLVLPLLATLFPPLYNEIDPRLFDIPFFYWYQLAAIGVSVLVTLVVYTRTRS